MSTEPSRPRASQRPRFRYVLVHFHGLPAGASREVVIEALRGLDLDGASPWLTRFDGSLGILRVPRGFEKRLRERLESPVAFPRLGAPLRVEALRTSGTIASLERQYRRP